MDWQRVAVAVFVFAAVAYVLRATWRTWLAGPSKGCAGGCGKCPAPADVSGKGRRSLPQV